MFGSDEQSNEHRKTSQHREQYTEMPKRLILVTTLGMTHEARKEKQTKVTDSSLHAYQKNIHISTEQELPGPTWSTPREFQVSNLVRNTRQPGSDLVRNTRDSHFAEVRCTTCGTGCLPIDSLFQLTHFCVGMNLERKHQEITRVSGAPTQTRDTEARVQPQDKGRQHQ